MRTTVKLIIIGIVLFLFPVTALNPVPSSRLERFLDAEDKMLVNIKHHEAHDKGLYTKALLNEMKAVRNEISEVMVELGCPEQQEDPLCSMLFMQALQLTTHLAYQKHMWHDHAHDQVMKGMANSGQQGGKVVFNKVVREDAGPE